MNSKLIDDTGGGISGNQESSILDSILKLNSWLKENDYKGYEPFDGLSSYLRYLTLNMKLPQQLLIQFVLRCPINIRPILGIRPHRSTKGIGFVARGYLRLFKATSSDFYKIEAMRWLDWLVDNSIKDYSGYCWGNDFDYRTRGAFTPRNCPTAVWVSLIAHTFLDAYEILGNRDYLEVANSSCKFIVNDLPRERDGSGVCISYLPTTQLSIHNSNMLAASVLARTSQLTGNEEYMLLAQSAIAYSIKFQHQSGAWFYGEDPKYHWIDNWHTAYTLDSLKWFLDSGGDNSYMDNLKKGFRYYIDKFFEKNGAPKYFHNRIYPIDIQSCAQSIDTLCFFVDIEPESVQIANKVALWTINNMQVETGYFYFRAHRYANVKIPMLHWGQGTMFGALSHLYLISTGYSN